MAKAEDIQAKSLALQSSVIELSLSAPALIFNLKAALFGILLSLGAVAMVFLVALYFPQHLFAKRARSGSASEAFWRGLIWKSYCASFSERSPSIMALILDNWALAGLLIFASVTENPLYSCVLLGIGAGISLIVLVQFALKME